MKLTKGDVEHLAELAHLSLGPGEMEKFPAQMSAILDYVGKLAELPPAAAALSGTDAVNVMRKDEARPADEATREAILNNFPARRGELLSVPAVFDRA